MTARPLALLPIVSLLALLSCSDPPEQPAAVGLNITLQNPSPQTTTTRICTAGSSGTRTFIIGDPSYDGTIESGKDGVDVKCTVNRDGTVQVTASGIDDGPSSSQSRHKITLTINGRIKSNTDPTQNPASVTFFSPDTTQIRTTTDYACTIGPVSALQDGALLTDFSCELLSVPNDTSGGCRASGKIALEYCKTGKEED